jgi:hypothetical protein
MATSAQPASLTTGNKLNVLRVATAASLSAVAFVLLCWIGARLGLGPATHMYIQLFSGADVASIAALLVGLCWSLAGGAIAGGLFAFIYNLLAGIDAR